MRNNFGRSIVKGFKSLSNWEDSYFGGYENILWDHPEIKVDTKLNYEFRGKEYLNYYTYNKLIKLFLLNVKEKRLSEAFVSHLKGKSMEIYGRKIKRYWVTSTDLRFCIEHL